MAEAGDAAIGDAGDVVVHGGGDKGVVVSDSGVGGSDLPSCRRSARKLPRSPSLKGRRVKSCPKSPLMRMAELRKGFDGSDFKKGKGRKGSESKGPRELVAIPENSVVGVGALGGTDLIGAIGEGVSEGVRGAACSMMISDEGKVGAGVGVVEGGGVGVVVEAGVDELVAGAEEVVGGSGGLVDVLLEDRIPIDADPDVALLGSGSGGSTLDRMAEGSVVGFASDPVLDLVASQPMQDMAFIDKIVELPMKGRDEEKVGEDCLMGGMGEEEASGGVLNENFPLLSKENLRSAKDKGKFKGVGGNDGPKMVDHPVKVFPSRFKEGSSSKVGGNNGAGPRNYKASLADGVRLGGNLPVSFEPGKMRKMGVLGETCGLPSIQFSSEETSYLEEKMGFSIVGKFSHSLPTSLQIQRAFVGIKFKGEFTWKYINAKHVLVQFSLIEDYAKLLNGPNGMPVWFVDRHPMRVFKWTTDFDPFFESPIAAVWCNLVGLPIHLFEKSALFAIGGLLGVPLQVDHATISRSRLSFARLCIEIDISKSQVQEIVLNIQGREIRQMVRWDRIPLYCQECKHVGHSREVCYANGNGERPLRKNFARPVVLNGRQEEGVSVVGLGASAEGGVGAVGVLGAGVEAGARGSGAVSGGGPGLESGEELLNEGFQLQGKRRGRQGQGGRGVLGSLGGSSGVGGQGLMSGSSGGKDSGQRGPFRVSTDSAFSSLGVVASDPGPCVGEGVSKGGGVQSGGGGREDLSLLSSANRFSVLSSDEVSLGDLARGRSFKPKYLKMLPNGDFDSEVYEDEGEGDEEDDLGSDSEMQLVQGVDKRGAASDLIENVEENVVKKGRISEGASSMVSHVA